MYIFILKCLFILYGCSLLRVTFPKDCLLPRVIGRDSVYLLEFKIQFNKMIIIVAEDY